MTKRLSLRERLEALENEQRFSTWLLSNRYLESLTGVELEAFARAGELPDPVPNRPSRLDGLDRESLVKLWEEDERLCGYRSSEDLMHFSRYGKWPEEMGRFRYSQQDGKVFAQWRLIESSPDKKTPGDQQ
jgi:hypothetical protein